MEASIAVGFSSDPINIAPLVGNWKKHMAKQFSLLPDRVFEIMRDKEALNALNLPAFILTENRKTAVREMIGGVLALQARSNAGRCKLFVGTKGSGKSTLMRIFIQIIGHLVPNIVPLYVDLDLLSKKEMIFGYTLTNMAKTAIEKRYPGIELGRLRQFTDLITEAKKHGFFVYICVDEVQELYKGSVFKKSSYISDTDIGELSSCGSYDDPGLVTLVSGSSAHVANLCFIKYEECENIKKKFPLYRNARSFNAGKYRTIYLNLEEMDDNKWKNFLFEFSENISSSPQTKHLFHFIAESNKLRSLLFKFTSGNFRDLLFVKEILENQFSSLNMKEKASEGVLFKELEPILKNNVQQLFNNLDPVQKVVARAVYMLTKDLITKEDPYFLPTIRPDVVRDFLIGFKKKVQEDKPTNNNSVESSISKDNSQQNESVDNSGGNTKENSTDNSNQSESAKNLILEQDSLLTIDSSNSNFAIIEQLEVLRFPHAILSYNPLMVARRDLIECASDMYGMATEKFFAFLDPSRNGNIIEGVMMEALVKKQGEESIKLVPKNNETESMENGLPEFRNEEFAKKHDLDLGAESLPILFTRPLSKYTQWRKNYSKRPFPNKIFYIPKDENDRQSALEKGLYCISPEDAQNVLFLGTFKSGTGCDCLFFDEKNKLYLLQIKWRSKNSRTQFSNLVKSFNALFDGINQDFEEKNSPTHSTKITKETASSTTWTPFKIKKLFPFAYHKKTKSTKGSNETEGVKDIELILITKNVPTGDANTKAYKKIFFIEQSSLKELSYFKKLPYTGRVFNDY